MKRHAVDFGIIRAGLAFAALTIPIAVGQLPAALGITQPATAGARQPGGIFSVPLGTYLTIEGVKLEGDKVESCTLLVDTVDGKKLDKPVSLVIRGAAVVDHNLQPARLALPPQQRCIFKGFESGEMVGIPPAVAVAAKEQGWQEVPMSPVQWEWRPYFVALVVTEPIGLEIRRR